MVYFLKIQNSRNNFFLMSLWQHRLLLKLYYIADIQFFHINMNYLVDLILYHHHVKYLSFPNRLVILSSFSKRKVWGLRVRYKVFLTMVLSFLVFFYNLLCPLSPWVPWYWNNNILNVILSNLNTLTRVILCSRE